MKNTDTKTTEIATKPLAEYRIDAKDARLGKVAAEAAAHLMGKDRTDFARNVSPRVAVRIVNASQVAIDGRKMDQKSYVSYSGYAGGKKVRPLKDVVAKKGYSEIFRKAVKGMLPKNKLQSVMMNNLAIEE